MHAIRRYGMYGKFWASEVNIFSLKSGFNEEEVKDMLFKINDRNYSGLMACINNLIYLEDKQQLFINLIENPNKVENFVLI